MSTLQRIKEIIEYRDMIFSLVHRDLRGRYKGSVLGFFWTFLNPLLQLMVYTFVFSIIMRAGVEDYYLFLFVTLVPWTYFSTSLSGGASCVLGQSNLVNKIYFPREVLPIAHVLSQLVNMLLTFIVVVVVLLISGKGVNPVAWIFFPIVVLQETLLAVGFTFLLSSITVFFRDVGYLTGVLMMLWQYVSPVLYGVDMVPERFRALFYLNPLTPIMVAYRDIFYYKQFPQLNTFVTGTVMGVVVLIIGWIVFGNLQKKFAEVM